MRRSSPYVLVVDSYPDGAESTRDVLALYGFRVKTTTCCAEAVAISRAECPAAVITDTHLPDGDGWQLAGLLRSVADPEPAVIAIGSTTRLPFDSFDGWFLKPADPRQLAEALWQYLPACVGWDSSAYPVL